MILREQQRCLTCPISKKPLLGVNISVTTYDEVVDVVLQSALRGQSLKFTALDAHGLSRAAREQGFKSLINSFEIVTPDGCSLKAGLNMLHGESLKSRVAGPDLTLRVCQAASERGCPI